MIEIDRRDRCGPDGTAARVFPAEPEISRPNTAPAYYLGRPARLWITVMRPRRHRTAARVLPTRLVNHGGLISTRRIAGTKRS